MTASTSHRGTLRLSEVARTVVQPDGITSTSWPEVEAMCRKMGHPFDEWQRGAGRLILAQREDGSLAARIDGVGMSLPRQVGKTHLLSGIMFALCATRPGMLVLWTAQHSKTHEETFQSMQGFALKEGVSPYVKRVLTGSGDEAVEFNNGSRILFGARERGFGRGIPGVDAIVFDEAQIMSERALDAMLATMNTSDFGLALFIGTPPRPEDRSESFTRMREDALAGQLHDGVWIECGADPDGDPTSRAQVMKANPSVPHRTPWASIERLRRKLTPESFDREALGKWSTTASAGVIPMNSWDDCQDDHSVATSDLTLGIEVAPDLVSASVAVAGLREDGRLHIELTQAAPGVAWLGAHVQDLVESFPTIKGVVVDVGGPIRSLLEERPNGWRLRPSGVRVTPVKVDDLGDGCARLLAGVVTGQVRHIGQYELTRAAQQADRRDLGRDSGRWAWARKRATSDITPIQAATLALIGTQGATKRPTATSGSKKGGGRIVVY